MEVSYNEDGISLTIWFDAPWKEHYQEKKGSDLVLKKDVNGFLIGVEHLAYFQDSCKGESGPSRTVG